MTRGPDLSAIGFDTRRVPQRLPWIALILGFVGLLVLHLVLGREIVSPPRLGPGDQWGYLGNARSLAGGPAWVLPNFPYFTFGYSAALVPAHLLFDDPEALYLAVRVTNALLAASVLPLLYVLCRTVLGRNGRDSLIAGTAGALVPALIAHAPAALAESLVLPLCVATALACYAMVSERSRWQRLAFGPMVALLFATHNRFVLTIPIALALIAAALLARRTSRVVALGNVALLLVALAGVAVLREKIVDERWIAGIETPQGPASDAIDVFTDLSFFGRYVLELVGQIWYIAVGTLGIGLLGIGVLATRLRSASATTRSMRERIVGFLADEVRLTLTFVLASAAGVLAVSSYFFTRVLNGTEGYIAGRHNDSFTPIWVAAGVTFLVGERSRQTVLRAMGGVGAVIVASAALLLLVRDRIDWEGLVSPLNAPAVSFYGVTGRPIVLIPTAVALGAVVVLAAVRLGGRSPAVVLPVALVLVWAVSTDIEPDETYADWSMPEDFEQLEIERAAVVQSRGTGMPLYYSYFAPDLEAVPWDGTDEPPEPIVVAAIDELGMAERGARLVLVDEGVIQGFRPPYSMGVWVMPGPELRRFRRAGMLLPTPSTEVVVD